MRNLLIVPRPGDEVVLYSLLVLKTPNADWDALLLFDDLGNTWDESLARMGVSKGNRLRFPVLPAEQISVSDLAAALHPYVFGYQKVYVPDATAEGVDGVIAAAISLTGITTIVTRTSNGSPDEIVIATPSDWSTIICHVNTLYGHLIRNGRLSVQDMKPVCCYRNVAAADLKRYWNEYSNWSKAAKSDDDDPWDLSSSIYEQKRHTLELEVISGLEWEEMVEIGGCVGAFTQLALQRFPHRRISTIEPVPAFAEKLARRTQNRARIITAAAQAVDEAFDLVLLSSTAYYMSVWPYALLNRARHYVVTSHKTEYEEHIIVPAMQSSGWQRLNARLLEPCFEEFCGFTVEKDGTTVSTWRRSSP